MSAPNLLTKLETNPKFVGVDKFVFVEITNQPILSHVLAPIYHLFYSLQNIIYQKILSRSSLIMINSLRFSYFKGFINGYRKYPSFFSDYKLGNQSPNNCGHICQCDRCTSSSS